ncbi:hypothetical protein ANTQUA_LOCUS2148 [Anthophora quadrimaculata]
MVTERVCLPFIPGRESSKDEKIKIDKLHLKGHEWKEGAFTKYHGEPETESVDNENERKRSLFEQDRLKRNVYRHEDASESGFCIDDFGDNDKTIETQIKEPFLKYENYSSQLADIFMITELSKTSENNYRKNADSKKYRIRSMLEISENYDDVNEANIEEYDYERQFERNRRQEETTSPWLTENIVDTNEEVNFGMETESSEKDSLKDIASDDSETESVSNDEAYRTPDSLEDGIESYESKEEASLSEDYKRDDGIVNIKKKTRQTPGPEWPTEALTAYHVGGTKTWVLEYPERDLSEESVSNEDEENFQVDSEETDAKQPLGPTTCYYVILNSEEDSRKP